MSWSSAVRVPTEGPSLDEDVGSTGFASIGTRKGSIALPPRDDLLDGSPSSDFLVLTLADGPLLLLRPPSSDLTGKTEGMRLYPVLDTSDKSCSSKLGAASGLEDWDLASGRRAVGGTALSLRIE